MATALLLDHTGSPLRSDPPKFESRMIRAKYDAAQTTPDNQKHWRWADGMSAAAANSPDVRRILRERARYEVANNCYAIGAVRTFANDVIGVGPQLQLDTGDSDIDRACESAFWRWWQAAQMTRLLHIARKTKMTDGELFVRFITNPRLRSPVKLDLRLYEGDQVARPWGTGDEAIMSDGIVFDDFGNPLAYTLLKHHPGDNFFIGAPLDHETVPARNMLHLFSAERPGQLRGVPELLAALPLFGQLRQYTLSVLGAAETAADLAILIQTQATPNIEPDDVDPLDLIDIERRSAMTLPRGWVANQMKAEQPTTTYEMFKRSIVQEIGRCICQTYGVTAGDHSGSNFASGQLDGQIYDRAIRVDRHQLGTELLDPIFYRWWEEAREREGVLPEEVRGLSEPPPNEWRWEGRRHQDPSKEANGQQVRLASLTTTLAREYARDGLDYEDELRQIAKERDLMKELGLTPADVARRPAQGDDDAEE